MTRRKMKLAVFVVVLTAVIIWQYPVLAYQWDYQICLLRQADHYPNVASLQGALDRPTYNDQSALQCEAMESERRFETAGSSETQTEWGLKAVLAYTTLIDNHHIDSFRSSRAAVYAGLGQFERSLADYDYLLATNPDNYWMYENRAKLYLQIGQPVQALQDYQALYVRALSDPTNSQAYLDRIAGVIAEMEEDK